MEATPRRSSPTIQPPQMFGKSYKPPRGKFASVLVMLSVGLVLLGVLTTMHTKQVKADTPRAVMRPKDRPLVIAVATFAQDIPNEKLHWMRYAFAEALSHALEGIEGVRVIDREFVLRAEPLLQHEQNLGIFAGDLGADLVLGGEVWQQVEGQIGVTVQALSPVNIFYAEEVAPEEGLFSLAALMAGHVAGTKLKSGWSPSDLSLYREYLSLKYEVTPGETMLARAQRLESAYTKLIERSPGMEEALHERAMQRAEISSWLFDEAKKREACADLQAAQNLSKREVLGSLLLATCDAPLDAITIFAQNKESIHTRAMLAETLLRYGLLEDARSVLRDIVKEDESAGTSWLTLAAFGLMRKDDKAAFFARHALNIEEQFRATPNNNRSYLRGWPQPQGSRTYVAFAERESLKKEELEKLLREDEGLYLKGGSLFGRDEIILRSFLRGELPMAYMLRSPLLSILLPPREEEAPKELMQVMQSATVFMLRGEKERAVNILQSVESNPKTKEETLLLARWRDAWLTDKPEDTKDWLLRITL